MSADDEREVLEVLDDIVIPKTKELTLPEPWDPSEPTEELLVVCKGASPDDDDERVRRFMGTLQTPDSRGDEVALRGWDFKRFKRNPALLWNHRMNGELDDMLGRVTRIKREKYRERGEEKEGIAFDAWFLPGPSEEHPNLHRNGDKALSLVDLGVLNACSVTFRPKTSQWIDTPEEEQEQAAKLGKRGIRQHGGPGVRWLEKEMLELSLCPVGAHPDALKMAISCGLMNADGFRWEDFGFEVVSKPGFEDQEGWSEIKYRVREPGLFQEKSIIRKTMQESPPVIGLFGKLKGQTTLTLQALRFPKEKGWTMEKAKAWVNDHKEQLKKSEAAPASIVSTATRQDAFRPPQRVETVETRNPDHAAWLKQVIAEARSSLAAKLAALPPETPSQTPSEATAETAPRQHRRPTQVQASAAQREDGKGTAAMGTRSKSAKRRVLEFYRPRHRRVFEITRRKK